MDRGNVRFPCRVGQAQSDSAPPTPVSPNYHPPQFAGPVQSASSRWKESANNGLDRTVVLSSPIPGTPERKLAQQTSVRGGFWARDASRDGSARSSGLSTAHRSF